MRTCGLSHRPDDVTGEANGQAFFVASFLLHVTSVAYTW